MCNFSGEDVFVRKPVHQGDPGMPVRTWHIINSGRDALLVDSFEKKLPTQKTVQFGQQVPGVILPGDNAFAVTQALSWLAKECRDIQAQFEWKQQIPLLVRPLLT